MHKKLIAIVLLLSAFGPSLALAQRPSAPKLFPQKTLLYARVDDTRELKAKMAETSMGRISNDAQIKPILNSFYSSFSTLVQGMQDAVGVNLDELLSIPNGELAIALVPTKTNPVFCAMLEAGDELPAVKLMIGRLEDRIAQSGGAKTTKEVGKISINQMRNGTREERQLGFFLDSGVLVVCSNAEYAETLAQIWQGSGIDHKSLADNREFTTILSRCVGTAGERPQVSFYANPLALYREVSKNSSNSLIVLTTLKTLGLDGIKGIGGSAIFAPNDFDSIIHAHLLLDNNRRGALRAVRPKSGSTEPELWVNDKVASYGTMNWDFEKTVKAIADIVDSFGGENTFENNVIANGSRQIGLDLRKDVLEMLNDRVTLAQLILPTKRINSQSNLVGIHAKDVQRLKADVLPRFFNKIKSSDARWTSKVIGDSTVYYIDIKNESPSIRVPQPSFAVVGDDLLASDAIESIEQAIKTYSSGDDLLGESIEYKLVRDRIRAQLKDKETSIMSYQRPEESLRLFYDLASDSDNISRLEESSANNPFLTSLVAALKGKNLPPFEVISKYLAPSGAFVVEEEDGLHYTAFSLRRE
ncbi:MAG: hypothetical protein NTY15_19380 [Planctomycetota bacterium]|nr:hypothetical protein [Planctomycetota bacterium]